MISMKRLYLVVLISIFSLPALSQAPKSSGSNCTQVLRLVRSTYESGRLHEIPDMVAGCLNDKSSKGFTKEERRETYRYLTLTHIYLEEPEKADEAMLNLLATDHFFQINQALDPAEFIALYNKFRHDPVFRLGIKPGLNVTQPNAQALYAVGGSSLGAGKYGLALGLQGIVSFEKEFTKPNFMKNLVIAPELGFVLRKYKSSNPQLAFADENPATSVSNYTSTISQSFIDLNALVQYKIKSSIDMQTYIGGGPALSYLLGSSNQAATVLGNGFTVTGTTVDDYKVYNPLTYSFIVTAGLKKKIGEIYLAVDARYQYGLSNMVKSSARSNPELVYDYQIRYNDFRISTMSINVGLIYPYFKPKKLIK